MNSVAYLAQAGWSAGPPSPGVAVQALYLAHGASFDDRHTSPDNNSTCLGGAYMRLDEIEQGTAEEQRV